ncbi:spermidine/putrescine ABC transporter membrane protein [Salmonella enterica subsp. enterica]|uniref:Spermidine/putrescine ABC transporter membrane protein n=1 Tax=Salmonella enterica I TaxID=59201 RepID=A0A379WAQ1_SALET|nr:spermidine/putrescine ABC transporter membrane protein [Salmonella enterica subsp. enterica]
MIGRLLRGGFMTAIYAYLYIPIIILIVKLLQQFAVRH